MSAPEPSRLAWADLSKGVLVVLVVLMHTTSELAHRVPDTFWLTANGLLEPVRMPVFFTVSGMLAAQAVRRPWQDTTRRTWGLAVVYVLWTSIFAAVVAGSPQVDALQELASLPTKLLFAASGYWYLYALVVYFVIARLARGLPPALVIVVAAVPNLLRPLNETTVGTVLSSFTDSSMAAAVTFNLVFFLAGAYYRDGLLRVVAAARWATVLPLAGILIAAGVLRAGMEPLWSHTFLPLSIGWVAAALMGANLIAAKDTAATRFARHLGRRTLPIYVVQFPLLVVLTPLLLDADAEALSHPLVQASYPVVVTAVEVAVALLLHALASGTFLGVLVSTPSCPWIPKVTPSDLQPLEAPAPAGEHPDAGRRRQSGGAALQGLSRGGT